MVIWLRRCSECSLPSISMEPKRLCCPNLRISNESKLYRVYSGMGTVTSCAFALVFARSPSAPIRAHSGVQQPAQSPPAHLALELRVRGVMHGLHSQLRGGGNVLCAVVDKQNPARLLSSAPLPSSGRSPDRALPSASRATRRSGRTQPATAAAPPPPRRSRRRCSTESQCAPPRAATARPTPPWAG